jgi:hypothetical protein
MKVKKQILISLTLLGSVFIVNAQWTGNNPIYTNASVKVGIGTNFPNGLLELKGTGSPYSMFRILSSGGGGFSIGAKDDTPNPVWVMESNDGESMEFKPGGLSKLSLSQSGIGIGTNSPNGLLELKGTGSPYSMFRILSSGGGGFSIGAKDDTPNPVWVMESNDGESMEFKPGGLSKLSLSQSGVGIGTTCPQAALDVAGTIRAKEVKVELFTGCDFVFKKDYKLMDLNELEKFVTTKQHLPEIAPEKEMIENGLNMKEFQMKLLQKMEEMTLYIIEQNRKNEKQDQELKMLKAKIKKMNSIKR